MHPKHSSVSSFHPELIPYVPIDEVGVEERIKRFQSRSLKNPTKLNALYLTLNMIDLTTLEGKDTPGKIKQLCYKAHHLYDQLPHLPSVAAVCVFPTMVRLAKSELKNTKVKVVSVATGFPSGQTPLETKKMETHFALDEGADEIDMVISRGKFLQGEYHYIFDEIATIKEICGKIKLKVILETGELLTLDRVRKASDLAILAGADFIKTSTGKIQPAATMPVIYTMLMAIRDHFDKTGKMVGMKPAGGISTSKMALQVIVMVNELLGDAWLDKEWFRFGASSLVNDVLMQIVKSESGVYPSSDYFSID